MRNRRNRGLQGYLEDDPLSSVASPFDIAMVFSAALMDAMVNYLSIGDLLFSEEFTIVKNPGQRNMEIVTKNGKEIRRDQGKASATDQGKGKRVGTAFQLESGKLFMCLNRHVYSDFHPAHADHETEGGSQELQHPALQSRQRGARVQ